MVYYLLALVMKSCTELADFAYQSKEGNCIVLQFDTHYAYLNILLGEEYYLLHK